jgi:hypothetical protein
MNQLIEETLLETRNIQEALIVKRTDGSVKARTKCAPTPSIDVLTAFDRVKEVTELGITIDDVKYECVRCDYNSLYLKHERKGCIAVRTSQYVIYGWFKEDMHPSVAVEAVEVLGEYFRTKGK